ncbi:hypothetical protein D3C80_736200 [compost metagenome]
MGRLPDPDLPRGASYRRNDAAAPARTANGQWRVSLGTQRSGHRQCHFRRHRHSFSRAADHCRTRARCARWRRPRARCTRASAAVNQAFEVVVRLAGRGVRRRIGHACHRLALARRNRPGNATWCRQLERRHARARAPGGGGRRLRRVPYGRRRQGQCRGAGNGYAFWHVVQHQYYPRPRNRYRPLVLRCLRAGHARRYQPRWPAPVPGVSLHLVSQHQRRRPASAVCLPDVANPGRPGSARQPDALPVQPAAADGRLECAVFATRRIPARPAAQRAVEPRCLPGRRPGPLHSLPFAAQPDGRRKRR